MTRCGDSNEWISAGLHASIALAYGISIAAPDTLADRIASRYRRWVAYPLAAIYHAGSTVEHLQRGFRERAERVAAPLFVVLALALVLPGVAVAHPGRLDAKGCHVVSAKGFVYQDGRKLPPGDRHCHRPLGAARLDEERFDEAPAPAPPRSPVKGKAR